MIWLDHAVRIVPDFAATERRLRHDHGLEAARWEMFPDAGVASRLFVLGHAGIELMGVREPARARAHPFGRLVLDALQHGERWLGAAVGTDELDVHAARLGLSPMTVSSVSSEGEESTFRMIGDPLSNPPGLPFFIEWNPGTEPWPRKDAALNPRYRGLAWVVAAGDGPAVVRHL